jgi:hypothetical protein
MARAEPQVQAVFANRSDPWLQRTFSDAFLDRLQRWWEARHTHLQTLDRLPQTLCHGDPQLHNLFMANGADGRAEVVAIDWCAAGLGPIGADAAGFSCTGMSDLQTSLDGFVERVEHAYQSYLAGMRAAGWTGDHRLVRLGFTASMARVKAMLVFRCSQVVLDDAMRERMERFYQVQGTTLAAGLDRMRDLIPVLDAWLEESSALRDALL